MAGLPFIPDEETSHAHARQAALRSPIAGRRAGNARGGFAAVACSESSASQVSGIAETTTQTADVRAGLVTIEARNDRLYGPDEIPSGWTTLRLENQSGMTHFAAIEKLPAGIHLQDQQDEVAPVFQDGMDLLAAGQIDEALAVFGTLPAWFFDVVFMGGPGMVAGGHSGETTVYLEPGTYLLECYVKTNGRFHSFNPNGIGMVHEITVTDAASGAKEPRPTLSVDISSTGGIEVDGHVRPGRHTIAVNFLDQTVYGHFLGHDVQLVRLADDTDLEELGAWMNWTLPHGLETPAPAEFMGGVQEMPAGSTGYFDVLLTPGRYAWISEVPDPASIGMLQTFEVP